MNVCVYVCTCVGKKKTKGKKKVKKQPSRPLSPVYIEVQVGIIIQLIAQSISMVHTNAIEYEFHLCSTHSENNSIVCENTNHTLFLRDNTTDEHNSDNEIRVYDQEVDSENRYSKH